MNNDYDNSDMFEAHPSHNDPIFSWDWTAFIILGVLALMFAGLLIQIIKYGA